MYENLLDIYEHVYAKQLHVPAYETAHQKFSAKNLIAYIELQKRIDPTLIQYLRKNGLILTDINYILKGLQKTCVNLGSSHTSFQTNKIQIEPFYEAIHRKRSLFNIRQRNKPEIMVTLDKHTSEKSIKHFLLNGMTIARINGAYGTWEDWEKIIKTVRRMEKMWLDDADSLCKIYMDLAGAKIRIGKLQETTYPLKIKVNKDRYGAPLRYKKGLLTMKEDLSDLTKDNFNFILPLKTSDNPPSFSIGDTLRFKDAQHRKRQFSVSAIHPEGYIVTINETSYLEEGLALFHVQSRSSYKVGKLSRRPVDIYVKKDDRLKIHLSSYKEGKAATQDDLAEISINLPEAFTNIKIGDPIYIDDGKIYGTVEHVDKDFIIAKVIHPTKPKRIKEYKGINLPETKVNLSPFTNKDIHDLAFVCENSDFLGASFIQTADDLSYLRSIIPKYKIDHLTIVAKIETVDAVNNLADILLEGLHFPKFAVMVARGDLAIEVGFEKLTIIQKEMLNMCQAAHVPIILATQVLDSLAKKGIPSRSELADLMLSSSFDCVMLNKGPYADEAVHFIKETLQLIDKYHRCNYQFIGKSKK